MITPTLCPTFARRLSLALLWIAPAASGCGGSAPTVPLHPTTGQVLFQGKPLEGVQVTFRPEGQSGPASVAQTDQEGKFHLMTAVGADGRAVEGAPAGEYAVALASSGRSDSSDLLHRAEKKSPPSPIGTRYADARTSGLKATIKPGPNALEPFNLKETGGAAPPVSSDRDRR